MPAGAGRNVGRMSLRDAFPATAADIPAPYRLEPVEDPVYVLDGAVAPFDGAVQAVRSPIAYRGPAPAPITLGVQAMVGADLARAAVDAAERAWSAGVGEWPSASAAERVAAVERFATALEAETDRIATLLMYEIGKPLGAARAEVSRSIEYIRATNELVLELDRAARTVFTGAKGTTIHHALERREPLGKVLCVAPFNYPVNELLTTLIPALLMGNVVIAKTPRFGVLANLAMAGVFAACFPPGVISLLPGDGKVVIPPIMQAAYSSTEGGKPGQLLGMIDMLAFIGSEGAAHAIMRHHPSPVSLHKVLGLGAKNAAIVLPGADCARAAAALVKGSLGFNGQRCTAEKLIFVHRSEADRFVDAFTTRVEALRVGMPWDDEVAITPLPEDGKTAWMRAYVDEAVEEGARVTNTGGGEVAETLMRPAVLFPVRPSMRIFHEEQFGPIVPIAIYDDVAEVIAWQQATPYGQQVGIWGPAEVHAPVVHALRRQVSRINLDDVCQRGPDSFGFTATDKSGFGILSLRDALLTFSRPVLVQSTNPALLA